MLSMLLRSFNKGPKTLRLASFAALRLAGCAFGLVGLGLAQAFVAPQLPRQAGHVGHTGSGKHLKSS